MKDPISLQNILSKTSSLEKILMHAGLIKKANILFHETLPPDWCQYCKIVQIEATKVTMQVDSASLATKLRYEIEATFKEKLKSYLEIQQVQVFYQIRPLVKAMPLEIKQAKRELSLQSRQDLRACAQYTKHSRLKQALEKLAEIS